MCAGLLQSVPRGAAECVQGYRVCAGCSFNILPCSTRLNQKIFYWKKKYFIWMCIKNKNYMENWLFWGLNLGNLKQCMMIMLVLTSSSSAWTLCSLLHISSLINICNFYSFWATGMVLTSKWGRILQEIHCQCQIWLNCPAAGRRPANFHKRNYLLSVNTTDFEKTTIQAHSALSAQHWYTAPSLEMIIWWPLNKDTKSETSLGWAGVCGVFGPSAPRSSYNGHKDSLIC